MNLRGKAITFWLQELKIPIENLLVIVDGIVLPFANFGSGEREVLPGTTD